MTLYVPTGSIMWSKVPFTDTYMPYRMRTLIKLYKVVNGQKTELLISRFSSNGGVFGENNHPEGSSINVSIGQYCYVIYNISENQVPINMTVQRSDSSNTNSIWGCAKDIDGNASYKKVEAGEVAEIYFNVENFEGSQWYKLNCNAWFVSGGLEQNFTSSPVNTVKDYSINPLRIGRPILTEANGNVTKENFITVRNYITAKGFDLPNTQYFEGTQTINPFFEPDNNVSTQNPFYAGVTSPTQTAQSATNKNTKKYLFATLALLTVLKLRNNENIN